MIYKTVGKGTEEMAGLKVGQELDLLMPLGHGFNVERAGERPVLIGGGAGAAPLYFLAKEIIRANPKAQITVLLGFNTKDEILLESEFETLLCKAHLQSFPMLSISYAHGLRQSSRAADTKDV